MLKVKAIYGTDPENVGFYWPGSRQKREEVMSTKRLSPDVYESTYQGRPGQREGSIFLAADFAYYRAIDGLPEGLANDNVRQFVNNGHMIVQAWDTAYGETKNSKWSVCVTALLVPCSKYHRDEDPVTLGVCDHHFDVYILHVLREKIDFGNLIGAIKTQYMLWKPEAVVIEDRASGISAIETLKNSSIPIVPVKAEVGKRARAVQGVGAGSAQGWFRLHRVLLPDAAPWLRIYVTEMKDFSGAEDATSDQVDATVHLLRYAIMTGATMTLLPTGWTPERGTPSEDGQFGGYVPLTPDGALLTFLGDLDNMPSYDPFEGLCGRCHFHDKSWCSVHKRNTPSMDTCQFYTERQTGGSLEQPTGGGISLGR